MKNSFYICSHAASQQFKTAQGIFCVDCGTLRAISGLNKQTAHLDHLSQADRSQTVFYEKLGEPSPNQPRLATKSSLKQHKTPSIIDIRRI